MDSTVTFAVRDAIGTITLNRPEKLNAIDPGMLGQIEAYVRQIEADASLRCVVLAAAGGRAFSVGADINAWSALEPLDMWRTWVKDGHRVLDSLASLRQPVVAAINGLCLGGGLELALAADIRIAAYDTRFGAPEVKIGTLPGWGGTKRLALAAGEARAMQMIFTGEQIDALQAERWGLVNEIVPASELHNRTVEIAQLIAANAPVAVQLAKQAIQAEPSSNASYAFEAIAGALAASTADGVEGVSAFRQKRPPDFTGR